MANHVVVTICGEDYTFVAEESAAYMQKVGSYVNDKMTEVLESSKVGRTDAADTESPVTEAPTQPVLPAPQKDADGVTKVKVIG